MSRRGRRPVGAATDRQDDSDDGVKTDDDDLLVRDLSGGERKSHMGEALVFEEVAVEPEAGSRLDRARFDREVRCKARECAAVRMHNARMPRGTA